MSAPSSMRNLGKIACSLITVSLLVALACESPTPVAPAESGLSISANPTRIAIDGDAEITVIARKSDGSAVNEGTEINFSTSLGRIDPLIAKTDDRGVASAVLSGTGEVGVATVEASSGAAAPVMLDIQVGAQPATLTLQANPPRIPKDGGSATLIAGVSDDLGNPLPNVTVRFGTEAGTLESGGGSVLTQSDGTAEDTLELTAFDVGGVTEGFFLVSVETIGVDNMPLTAEFEMEVGGFVQTVILTPNPGTISATGEPPVTLNALVLDDAGDVVVGAGVVFGTNLGTLQSAGRQVPTDSEGVATDTLIVTSTDLDAFGTGTSFQVEASTPGLGGDLVAGNATILISTSAGTLVLEVDPVSVECGVASDVTLEVELRDENGTPAEGFTVFFDFNQTPTVGTISPPSVMTDGFGRAESTLTLLAADVVCTTESSTISVKASATVVFGNLLESFATVTVNAMPAGS